MPPKQRVQPGNPLWIEFIEEWIHVAEAKGSKAADTYRKVSTDAPDCFGELRDQGFLLTRCFVYAGYAVA